MKKPKKNAEINKNNRRTKQDIEKDRNERLALSKAAKKTKIKKTSVQYLGLHGYPPKEG